MIISEIKKNKKNKKKTVIRCVTNKLFLHVKQRADTLNILPYLANRHRGGPIEKIPKGEAAVEQYVKEIGIVTFQGYVITHEIVQYQ